MLPADPWLAGCLHLEMAVHANFHRDVAVSKVCLAAPHRVTLPQVGVEAAQAAVGLHAELSGALGMRTRFQQRALPQVCQQRGRWAVARLHCLSALADPWFILHGRLLSIGSICWG